MRRNPVIIVGIVGKDIAWGRREFFLRHHEVASVALGYLSNLGWLVAKLDGVSIDVFLHIAIIKQGNS